MRQFASFILTLVFFPMMLVQVLLGAVLYWTGRPIRGRLIEAYGKNLALAADQNLNTIWLGHPDETVSSRVGRAIVSGKPKWYIKFLLHPFVDGAAQVFGDKPNHCVRSIEKDVVVDEEIWRWYSV